MDKTLLCTFSLPVEHPWSPQNNRNERCFLPGWFQEQRIPQPWQWHHFWLEMISKVKNCPYRTFPSLSAETTGHDVRKSVQSWMASKFKPLPHTKQSVWFVVLDISVWSFSCNWEILLVVVQLFLRLFQTLLWPNVHNKSWENKDKKKSEIIVVFIPAWYKWQRLIINTIWLSSR